MSCVAPLKSNVPEGDDPAATFASVMLEATASDGVLVEFVTVGTSQEGHDPDGAENDVTVALEVLQVGHAIAPDEATVIGEVPLNPALPTEPIGMVDDAVGAEEPFANT